MDKTLIISVPQPQLPIEGTRVWMEIGEALSCKGALSLQVFIHKSRKILSDLGGLLG